MPKLDDCHNQLFSLVDQIDKANCAYRTARDLFEQISSDAPSLAISNIGLSLKMADGVEMPVPLPEDKDVLLKLIEDSLAFAANEVVRLWNAAQAVTNEAVTHCNDAAAQAAAGG